MDAEERAERNRLRHRQLAVQIKRALTTLVGGIQQWLNDDPDEEHAQPDVIPGDSRTMRHSGNVPPHKFG